MVAIIGGEPHRFRPLIDLYRRATAQAGHDASALHGSINVHGFVAATSQEAADIFYPAQAEVMNRIGRERGWPPTSRAAFDGLAVAAGAKFVGTPAEVTDKILANHAVFDFDRFLDPDGDRGHRAWQADAGDRALRHARRTRGAQGARWRVQRLGGKAETLAIGIDRATGPSKLRHRSRRARRYVGSGRIGHEASAGSAIPASVIEIERPGAPARSRGSATRSSTRARRAAAHRRGATHVLLTHGHGDHAADTDRDRQGDSTAPVVGIYDLLTYWRADARHRHALGFNKGGTVRLGDVAVTMVAATHSSSSRGPRRARSTRGTEAGFMIEGEGRTIYFSGDTDVMADMGVFEELHHPEIGILCAGGHFTMGMEWGSLRGPEVLQLQDGHPLPLQDLPAARALAGQAVAGLPGVRVIEPQILEPIEL